MEFELTEILKKANMLYTPPLGLYKIMLTKEKSISPVFSKKT